MENESSSPFPQSKLLLFVSKMVICAWGVIAIGLIGALTSTVTKNLYIFLGSVSILMPIVITYLVLAFMIKCTNCHKAITIQSFTTPPYVNANKIKGIIGWSGIILNVILNKKFTCMHCGTNYKINE